MPSAPHEETDSQLPSEDIPGSHQSPPPRAVSSFPLYVWEEKENRIYLSQREADLLKILRKLLDHTRCRNASGYFTRQFCGGCEHRRLDPCCYDEALSLVEYYEEHRDPDLVYKPTTNGMM